MVDLLDEPLVTRAEILDQRGACRLQPAIYFRDAAREALARLVERLREPRADMIDLLDETLVTRAEILDERRARRLQPAVHLDHAARETLARLVEGLRKPHPDMVDLFDKALVTRSEILYQLSAGRLQPAVHVGDAACKALAGLVERLCETRPDGSICSTRPS